MLNRIVELFGIKYPIIQGGMVWVSGWKLVSAVSNCGGLGLIGAGSMKHELLAEHIRKCNAATENPFGVNIPLLRKDSDELIKTVVAEGVKIVFTSAGNPAKYFDLLKSKNIIVVHVVSNLKQAIKAERVGCDAIVAEGVEAGGHNGADEIPTMELLRQLSDEITIPIIAAGGIAAKETITKIIEHGAEGVQIGTLFAATKESSAHINYKRAIVEENNTVLIFKNIGLIRSIANPFAKKVLDLEKGAVSEIELREVLGEKREKLGIFEGDREDGILEAGTGIRNINKILSVEDVFKKLI